MLRFESRPRAARAVAVVAATALLVPSLSLLPSGLPIARGEDKALAVSLFEEGKKLMEAGKYEEACKRLEASKKADPSADGVVLRLALCYQALDRHASAWALFKESLVRAEKAKRKDRIDASKKGISETEAKMSRVTIQVAADARAPGLEVTWDDKPLDEGSWGIAFPVDPGPHKLIVRAPGRKALEVSVTVGATADKKTIEVTKLEPEPKPAPSASAAPATSASTAAPVASASTPPSSSASPPPTPPENPSYVAPLVVTGLGVAALGVGAYFGLAAKSANDDSKAECRADNRCSPAGTDLRNDAISKANLSTLLFIGGGVVVASGLTWVLLTGPSKGAHAQVGVVPGGLVLTGRF